MRLEGRVALITGGGTGIGRAVAHGLANEGASVVVTGRNIDTLRSTCHSIDAATPVRHRVADVSDRARVQELVRWTENEVGGIEIVVNSAGINIRNRRIDELSPEDWDLVMGINATGVFNVIHAVLPGMRAREDGIIINISSLAGVRASPLSGAAYSASKHAMSALTRVISIEERDVGIRATNISPGEVDTPILAARPVRVSAEHRARILQPEDVAAAVVFVATLHKRAHVPELYIKPTSQQFA